MSLSVNFALYGQIIYFVRFTSDGDGFMASVAFPAVVLRTFYSRLETHSSLFYECGGNTVIGF